jgi:SPP1 family phage portal protein
MATISSTTSVLEKHIGRTKIYCDEPRITKENVAEILATAMQTHTKNSTQINYLYNYWRGDQPIYQKQKKSRPEINNKVVENRALEIVSFKTGYLCGEPIQYVSRGSTDEITQGIQALNDQMLLVGKDALDNQLVEWMYVAGTGYRIVLPASDYINTVVRPWLLGKGKQDPDEAVFKLYNLDPRYAFVIYYSGLGEEPIAGVKYITKQDKSRVFTVYTATQSFTITETNGEYGVTSWRDHSQGVVPIIEYPLNSIRIGSFEAVLLILDAMNTVQSNRIDGIEQFVQALIVIYGADIDRESALELMEAGVIKLPNSSDQKVDIKILAESLDQMNTQTLVDYMHKTVLDIVGMPTNTSGGMSTSDTGKAVEMRDGWSSTETRTKPDETAFKYAERMYFLKYVLRIMRDTIGTTLTLKDIEIKFTRRIYEGLLAKTQVLTQMLGTNKIPASLASGVCGLFSDPEDAAKQIDNHINSQVWVKGTYTSIGDQNKLVNQENIQQDSKPDDSGAQNRQGDDGGG